MIEIAPSDIGGALRLLLDKYDCGDMDNLGVAMVIVYPDGSVAQGYNRGDDIFRLLGGLESLKSCLLNDTLE